MLASTLSVSNRKKSNMAKGAGGHGHVTTAPHKKTVVSQIPGVTPFQKKYIGTSVSGLSGIVPFKHKIPR
jgi:hypothetical protein